MIMLPLFERIDNLDNTFISEHVICIILSPKFRIQTNYRRNFHTFFDYRPKNVKPAHATAQAAT